MLEEVERAKAARREYENVLPPQNSQPPVLSTGGAPATSVINGAGEDEDGQAVYTNVT